MAKRYKLEKVNQGEFNILDPDGDVVFTDTNQGSLHLLLVFLNEQSQDKYDISYTFSYRQKPFPITSSTILVEDVMTLTFSEANVTDVAETRGYGILTHLNRKHPNV